MRIDEKQKVYGLLALPFFVIVLAFLAGKTIDITAPLEDSEKSVIDYHTEIQKLPPLHSFMIAERLKDPFEYVYIRINRPAKKVKRVKPAVTKSQKPIRLTLIIVGKKRSYAILDGVTVTEGGLFRDYRVEQILQDRVVLSKNRTKRTIFLEE